MPYLAGESLRARLRRDVRLALAEAVSVTRQVANALGYAHREGVIHRDVKPENILLDDGRAVLMDFGLAKALLAAGGERLTETGIMVGTPAYMSPEQGAGSKELDGRSDMYSLGCVLYEMLSGEPPFTGITPHAVMARKLADPVPPLRTVCPEASPALQQVVERALARVPADRFPTIEAFGGALAL
jgi:serine/threonine-protein kinase